MLLTFRFRKDNALKLELNQRAMYTSKSVSQWLNVRVQLIGVAMVTGVSAVAIIEHRFQAANPGK